MPSITTIYPAISRPSSTDIIEALDGKQPLDADLTALAGAGNSAVLIATEAAFTNAKDSKLSGIEAGADVTDTTNVTAAGALMDSEVTSLSGIKTLTVPDNTTISSYGKTLVDDADAATARSTLGLGSMATQASSSVTITGGSIAALISASTVVATGGDTARTLADILGDLIDVKSQGAAGDGSSAHVAIQDAVDEAYSRANGGIVFVPPGTYEIGSTVDLIKNSAKHVKLWLSAGAIVKNASGFSDPMFYIGDPSTAGGAANVSVEGGVFKGVDLTGSRAFKLENANQAAFSHVHFENLYLAVDMEASYACSFTGCSWFTTQVYAIYGSTSLHNLTLHDCKFYDCGKAGTYTIYFDGASPTDNFVVEQCSFEVGWCAIGTAPGLRSFKFEGNYVEYFSNTPFYFIASSTGSMRCNWIALSGNLALDNLDGIEFSYNTSYNQTITRGSATNLASRGNKHLGTGSIIPDSTDFADGSASLPSIAHSGDSNTGMFFPAADTIGFSTGGSERARITSAGRFSIGGTSTTAYLELIGSGTETTQFLDARTIGVKNGSSTIAANGQIGSLAFVNNSDTPIAGISAHYQTAADGASAYLTFRVGNTADKMRLDKDGNLIVNGTSAIARLDVTGRGLFRGAAFGTAAAIAAETANVTVSSGIAYGSSPSVSIALGAANYDAVNNNVPFQWQMSTPSGGASVGMGLALSTRSFDGTSTYTLTERFRFDRYSNFGVGISAFGSSATNVIGIGSGTAPTTGPADTIQLYSSDLSAGNTIPSLFCEGSGVTGAGITNTTVTHKIAFRVNGTVYYALATTNGT